MKVDVYKRQMSVPALIGWVLNKYCITGTHLIDGSPVPSYDYTLPMIIFTSFGIIAMVFALPVSYTHLDVYKRQEFNMVICIIKTELFSTLNNI